LELKNCVIGEYAQGAGINHVVAEGCRLGPTSATISGPRSVWRNCWFAVQPGLVGWAIHSAEFDNCRFASGTQDGTTDPGAAFLSADGGKKTLTVAAVVSNTKITVAVTGDDNAEVAVIGPLDHGVTIRAASDPSKWGRITQIYKQDATHVAIEGEFCAPPLVGEVWEWNALQRLIVREADADRPGRVLRVASYEGAQRRMFERSQGSIRRLVFGFEDLRRVAGTGLIAAPRSDFGVYGLIKSIWVNVIRPYTGSSGAVTLNLEIQAPLQLVQSISLTQTGQRLANAFGTFGAQPGDALTPTNNVHFTKLQLAVITPGGFYPAYNDRTQLPDLVVELEVASSL
ncbi:MAG TPA: hypothetical protein VGJ84_22550, partial [Polyangiaceae bacterium]